MVADLHETLHWLELHVGWHVSAPLQSMSHALVEQTGEHVPASVQFLLHVAMLQFAYEHIDRLDASRNRAVDAFMRQQHAAFQGEASADRTQRLA